MASKNKGHSRGHGSGVKKHVVYRFRQYIGDKKGYSDRIGRKILLVCRRVAMRENVLQLFITPENIEKGGGNPNWVEKYKMRENIYILLSPEGSVINVFQSD